MRAHVTGLSVSIESVSIESVSIESTGGGGTVGGGGRGEREGGGKRGGGRVGWRRGLGGGVGRASDTQAAPLGPGRSALPRASLPGRRFRLRLTGPPVPRGRRPRRVVSSLAKGGGKREGGAGRGGGCRTWAHLCRSHRNARQNRMSIVSDASQREGHDRLQNHCGTRRTSRTQSCGTRTRQPLAPMHVCKGGEAHQRKISSL